MAAAALLVSGVLAPNRSEAQEPLSVVATIGMIADVAAEVGGDCIRAEAMIGPGLDPHLYQATASDVARLQQADAILYAGFGLEGQLAEVLERFGETRPTFAVSPAATPEDRLIEIEGYAGVDPHVWMDPRIWALTAPAIAEYLGTLSPDCAAAMEERAVIYRAQAEALADWVERSIASIPEENRTLVTAHDAFGYFSRAYGLREIGIQGISTESEASVADIRATAEAVVEAGVPAIFVETTINPRTVEAVIEAAGQRGHPVEEGGSLYSDAMGEPGTPGGTYLGMIYENTRTITEALGGAVPPLPAEMSGWANEWNLAAE